MITAFRCCMKASVLLKKMDSALPVCLVPLSGPSAWSLCLAWSPSALSQPVSVLLLFPAGG